jgi:hypothetical protein
MFPEKQLVAIEIWQLRWDIDASRFPPYDYAHPNEEVLLLSLPVEDGTESVWAER